MPFMLLYFNNNFQTYFTSYNDNWWIIAWISNVDFEAFPVDWIQIRPLYGSVDRRSVTRNDAVRITAKLFLLVIHNNLHDWIW